jgi:hypothetical protein
MRTAGDDIHETLYRNGWSVGVDAVHTTGGESRWIVTATKTVGVSRAEEPPPTKRGGA